MRNAPYIQALWAQGGVITPEGLRLGFVGDGGAPHHRVTVEPDWWLNVESGVTTVDPTTLPYRWFQRQDDSQVEIEIPVGVLRQITTERSIDSDAASATITIFNQRMDPNLTGQNRHVGDPGHFNPDRVGALGDARWGVRDQTWAGILVPGVLLRTYSGFGGHAKTIDQAVADGNLLRTGTWLVDDTQRQTEGTMTLICRDMAVLLLDQELYPPLIPYAKYPLQFCRFRTTTVRTPAVPVYDSSSPPAQIGPEGWIKTITDGALNPAGTGYWILGNDGGLFAYGSAPFYGSRGTAIDATRLSALAPAPSGTGYWMATEAGQVEAFGDVTMLGELATAPPDPIRGMRAHPSGTGYWLLDANGGVYAFGTAGYFGGTPVATPAFVDMQPTASGNGYWLLAADGSVYAFGDAGYLGGGNATGKVFAGMAAKPDGTGYYLAATDGNVYGYGVAPPLTPQGNWAAAQAALQDPIVAISMTPSGGGFILVGGDGGVFAFGDAPFWGSLPAAYQTTIQTDGTYQDFSDTVKLLLLWSGWLLYGPAAATVYGNIESTGTYSNDCLPPDLFDKKKVMDAITTVKETIGYLFWIDEMGAANFSSPNWFVPGNFYEDGSHVNFIPEVDERQNLTDYGLVDSNKPVRSELIISSNDPLAGFESTVTTRYTPPFADRLHGMVKPAMWVNQYFTKAAEQALMAELVAIQWFFKQRQGQAGAFANPAIQLNDQVWVFEEETGEASVKYVRGISTVADVPAGTYNMTLTLSHLGQFPNNWALR